MSIATEITRLTTLRNNIRSKLITLGIISDSSADLQDCYEGIYQVPGRTYADTDTVNGVTTIPSGYYDEALEIDSHAGTKYYLTGTDAPTSSIGNDGDLYLQTTSSNWLADNAEFVSTIYEASYTMDQTGYNTWTPSSTASAIIASSDISSTYTANMTDYEYLLRWRVDFRGVYSNSNAKGKLLAQCSETYQNLYRRVSTHANLSTATEDKNVCDTMNTTTLADYYSSASAISVGYNISYGIYMAATAATFSDDTTSPVVTFKTPVVNARTNSTYFSTTMAGNLTKASSTIVMIGELYRTPKKAVRGFEMSSLVDMYNNPLTTSSS